MSLFFADPQKLLHHFGVSQPEDIDLEALAWGLGAKVRYENIESCEAMITGVGDRAIITIDPSSGKQRARFSLAHEIGHWQLHRNQVLFCAKSVIGSSGNGAPPKEGQANRFAAELLMPHYLFQPQANAIEVVSFAAIQDLAKAFKTSRKATALRYVTTDPSASLLIVYGPNGRKWFKGSPDWPSDWWPSRELGVDTCALELMFGHAQESPRRSLYPASAFFDRRDADYHEVYAHSVMSGVKGDPKHREVLTLVVPKNPSEFG